jgi:hypothetical protein
MADHPADEHAPDPGDLSIDERTRNHERRLALARLSRAPVEAGLYDSNEFPEDGQDE